MIVIGLTGGIGSGKTTVAKMFYELGVPVYIADIEAKKLMNRSKVVKRKLIQLFGDTAYVNNKLNKAYIAKLIFGNKDLLQEMNAIVHPKVAKHFKKWIQKQESKYVIKEAAILFENGNYKECDYIITVTAPEQIRIKRVLERDQTSVKKIKAIINNQWNDKKKIELSDYVINNVNIEQTQQKVKEIHQEILKK